MAVYHPNGDVTMSTKCSYSPCPEPMWVVGQLVAGLISGCFNHAPLVLEALREEHERSSRDPVARANRTLATARRKAVQA